MRLTRFALENPIPVTLFYIFVGVAGLIAFSLMGRSILPPITLPVVTISAPYPGAAATEIERLVIEPIEDQLDALPNLERISASSQNGIATIGVTFRFGSDIETDRNNVAQALNAAQPNLPPDLVTPAVSKDDPAQAPVLEESVTSDVLSPGEVTQIVNRVVIPALRGTKGVGTVNASGSLTRQFEIAPRPGALDALQLTSLDVFRAIAQGNAILPGGIISSPQVETAVGIHGAATSVSTLETLPVATNGGSSVRLRDVAAVSDTYADPTIVARSDGDRATLIFVSHASGQDALQTIAGVRATFARVASAYPLLRFEQLRTDVPYTRAAIAGVMQTLGEGAILTVLVVLLFLHAWRNALVAAVAIPASLCAAFAAMWALGFTINVLTLMGLSLTIGILVDDSIVILEAITRNAARGLPADEAAMAGRRELGGAAFAITLVDVAVFAPIALMSGIVGEFMREFAIVIILATAFSLLVALTLTPLLASRWAIARAGNPIEGGGFGEIRARLERASKTYPWTFRTRGALDVLARAHAAVDSFNAWEARMASRYADRWLERALVHRRAVLFCAAGIGAISLLPLAMGAIPTEFSPPVNRGEVTADILLPPGTPLRKTDAVAQRFSNALLQDPAVKHVESTAGRAANGNGFLVASNVAELGIVLSDPASDGDALLDRLKTLRALAPDATVAGAGKGRGGMAPISYNVAGDSPAIDDAAGRIASALRENPYATDVRTSNAGLAPYLDIVVDEERARQLGISPQDAARTDRIATGGEIATKVRLPSGLVDVLERSDAADRNDIGEVRRFSIRSAASMLVPLGDVAVAAASREPLAIVRENRERVVVVTANTINGAPIGLVSGDIARRLRDPNFLPPGTHIESRGDISTFLETVAKILAALATSTIGVYAILAILYRSYTLPLIIMLSVPAASIGAFGLLFALNAARNIFPSASILQGQTLNLYSMLGIVMLVGLVAKNGILLVEYAERAVREGANANEAMREAARVRFRPILMTTLAMIAGMLPLALGHTIGAEYRKALGTVVIGGLSSSLLLTLFVVPAAYAVLRARATLPKRGKASRVSSARDMDIALN